MKKAIEISKKIYENLITLFFLVLIVFVLLQVIGRYILKISIPWTEELARYVAVVITFLGGVMVSRRGEQLGAFFLRDRITGIAKNYVFIINSLISLSFMLLMISGAIIMYRKQSPNAMASSAPWFPLRWLYIFLVVGMTLMSYFEIKSIIRCIIAIARKEAIIMNGKSCPFPEVDEK